MKKIIAALMILMMVFALCACGDSKKDEEPLTLVGSWESNTLADYIYTFNEDGTGNYYVVGLDMPFTYEDNGDSVSILFEGNTDATDLEYTIEGKTLTIIDSFGEPVLYTRK